MSETVPQLSPPRGIPADLHQRIQRALLNSGYFASDNGLRALFVDKRLVVWQHTLPHATDPADRVNQVIAFLFSHTHTGGENGLGLLLRVLGDQVDSQDAIQQTLENLADEVRRILKGTVFICYKRHAEPDYTLAHDLYERLTAHGYHVFIDETMRTGVEWMDEIERQIKASDFLVVLLSEESAYSEMVKSEVYYGYEYGKREGHPRLLPVRVCYEGLLPYAVGAFLDPLQYVVWWEVSDTERVFQELLDAFAGQLPVQPPVEVKPTPTVPVFLSEDGRHIASPDVVSPPLPDFDPRILGALEVPGGTVKLRDTFYVERAEDAELKHHIIRGGTIVTVRAARQTGKSSLLARGIYYARQQGISVVTMDLQAFDRRSLEDYDAFLRYLAHCIAEELCLDEGDCEQAWRSALGPQSKLMRWMATCVLPSMEGPLILALDEVDRLIGKPYQTDFFGMLRAWNNRAASDPRWEKLGLILVISTEPYLLIQNTDQSPFNVGRRLYLQDFDKLQVCDLNLRHGAPVTERDIPEMMRLLSGHPYLTRKALYTLVVNRWNWETLSRVAATDQGPFGDHLRHYYWLLRDRPELRMALREIVNQERCADDTLFFRLLQAGLVKGRGDVCACRCDLYRQYFKDKL